MNRGSHPGQLGLHFGYDEITLRHHLEECLGRTISLVLTDNSTSMLSLRVRHGVINVRLHRMFVGADDQVIGEIISFLKRRKGEMKFFRRFIRDNRGQLDKRPPKSVTVKTEGRFHDLGKLFDEINLQYFSGAITSAITWGPGSCRHAVRKRTLGSYSGQSNIIRINPMLDRKSVPRYFVAFVVYHEMLHADMGISRNGERRILHSREFRKREKLFADYERAITWECRSSA